MPWWPASTRTNQTRDNRGVVDGRPDRGGGRRILVERDPAGDRRRPPPQARPPDTTLGGRRPKNSRGGEGWRALLPVVRVAADRGKGKFGDAWGRGRRSIGGGRHRRGKTVDWGRAAPAGKESGSGEGGAGGGRRWIKGGRHRRGRRWIGGRGIVVDGGGVRKRRRQVGFGGKESWVWGRVVVLAE